MRRWLVLLFVVLLPLQFAWSAASAYCQHETGEPQSQHFGHHFHAHKAETKKPTASNLMADPDCATCHATGAALMAMNHGPRDFSTSSSPAVPLTLHPFASALTRVPDRPQWLRRV